MEHAPDKKLTLAVLSYEGAGRKSVMQLIRAGNLEANFNVKTGRLSGEYSGNDDIVLAVLTAKDDPEKYAADVSAVAQNTASGIVIGIISDGAQKAFSRVQDRVPLSQVITLPIKAQDFSANILRHLPQNRQNPKKGSSAAVQSVSIQPFKDETKGFLDQLLPWEEQGLPVQEKPPAQEAAPVQEVAPVLDEAPAQEETPLHEEPGQETQPAAYQPAPQNLNLMFGELLLQHGALTESQLELALEQQKGSGLRIGEILIKLGMITEEQRVEFLCMQLDVEPATAKLYAEASIDVVGLVPEPVARRNHCIALALENDILTVAMTDAMNLQLLDNLRDITEKTIKPVLGVQNDIQTATDRFYREINSKRETTEVMDGMTEDVEYVDQKEEEVDLEKAVAEGADLGIIKLVNVIIMNAVRDKASDIHIQPREKTLSVRYRVDGDLKAVMSPPKKSHQAIIARIKILSYLDIAEHRLPQDGRMVVKAGKREIDIRVSILPSIFGEKAVLRILDKDAFEKSVDNLGFSKRNVEIFRDQITRPYGMIIVTGPTGSGKSTTLYSAIGEINDDARNIITVEDPVEFQMDGVTQVNVQSKIDLTFGAVLRSVLRQDPDICLIGEIRDRETADIAVKMALTGHLVFSTLHTNDAASTIVRFTDIGIPPLLLSSALNLIIAQRLVRRICKGCKVEFNPPRELFEQAGIPYSSKTKLFKGEGCVQCNGTGYSGRLGLYEMLNVTPAIRKLILQGASTMDIQKKAVEEGMLTIRMAGIEKVLSGDTAVEQVLAVSTEV
jgi:type IV pilus assembly protein PilB